MAEGTLVSVSVLCGFAFFMIFTCLALSKLTRGVYCCKSKIVAAPPIETIAV